VIFFADDIDEIARDEQDRSTLTTLLDKISTNYAMKKNKED